MSDKLSKAAIDYHLYPSAGKLEINPTKKMVNHRDLSLAYSPGVAAPCLEIAEEPERAAALTARGNLVAVITNGTAVLGLGAIGPLASKPVMEGKAVLFKKFSGVDVFDLEVNEKDPDKFVDIVAALEPTFGGINLEDIKAPECFIIEEKLKERLNIPVFHDDQHGTAICVSAAIRNALIVANKKIGDVKLVCSGAGAAALACLDLLVVMGVKKENITVCDIEGVIYEGRKAAMNPYNSRYAIDTKARTLSEVIKGADIFMGLSAPKVLKADDVKKMAKRPVILALANPEPEILPEVALEANPDAIIATGRSDYPNQVNNVLCFPFLFRGALDVAATEINMQMKLACVDAIADLAKAESSDVVEKAYDGTRFTFGKDYLIPTPFDQRLMAVVPPAVAKAAMDSGVAKRPIENFEEYEARLQGFVYRSGMIMRTMFDVARENQRRIIYAEGESRRVLSAVQILVDDNICKPILIGRYPKIKELIKQLGLRIQPDIDFEVLETHNNPHYERDWQLYHKLNERNGVTPVIAQAAVLKSRTVLAALRVRQGEADGMICGVTGGNFDTHLKNIRNVIALRKDAGDCSTVDLVILKSGSYFIADTHVTYEPDAEHIAETTLFAASLVKRFGLEPKVALLSHSNFGESNHASAKKMRDAFSIIKQNGVDFEVEGEMQSDTALDSTIREIIFPNSSLSGAANLLIMPSLDAANIAFKLLKSSDNAVTVGPMLVGLNKAAHVLNSTVTVRGIVNMSAVASVHASRIQSKIDQKEK